MRRSVPVLLALALLATGVHADAITVRRLDGRCGENTLDRGAPTTPLVLHARPQRSDVRLTVHDLPFDCGAPPDFHVTTGGDHVMTLEPYLPAGAPVASCTCLHDLTLLLSHVPPGHWTIRIQTGTHVAPSANGLVAAPDYASTTVDVV